MPYGILGFTLIRLVNSFSLLFALDPVANELGTIGSSEGTAAIFLIVDIVTLVTPSIGPLELSVAVHFVVHPVSVINSAVCPPVLALAMELITRK